jgi:hypothetical protein
VNGEQPSHDAQKTLTDLRDHLARHDKPIAFFFGAGTSCSVRVPVGDAGATEPLIPAVPGLTAACKKDGADLGNEYVKAWTSIEAQCVEAKQDPTGNADRGREDPRYSAGLHSRNRQRWSGCRDYLPGCFSCAQLMRSAGLEISITNFDPAIQPNKPVPVALPNLSTHRCVDIDVCGFIVHGRRRRARRERAAQESATN